MLRKTRWFALIGVVVLLATAVNLTASAKGPIQTHYHAVGGDEWTCDSNGDGIADYTIFGSFWMNFHEWWRNDLTDLRIHYNFHGEIRNSLNDLVLKDRVATRDLYDFSQWPIVIDTWNGNIRHVILPGEGSLTSNAGRLILEFLVHEDGYWELVDVLFEKGKFPFVWGGDFCSLVGDGVYLGYVDGWFEVTKDLQ